jgi:hypothetical protein
MSLPPRTADAFLEIYPQAFNSAPQTSRPAVRRLRVAVGEAVDEPDPRIAELRLDPSERTVSTARRPGASSTIAAQRQGREDASIFSGPDDPRPGAAVETIRSSDPEWAMRFPWRTRDPELSGNELDRWISGSASGHRAGYVRANLRHTRRPGAPPQVRVGCDPYLRRLAVVARGAGSTMSNAGYEVTRPGDVL